MNQLTQTETQSIKDQLTSVLIATQVASGTTDAQDLIKASLEILMTLNLCPKSMPYAWLDNVTADDFARIILICTYIKRASNPLPF